MFLVNVTYSVKTDYDMGCAWTGCDTRHNCWFHRRYKLLRNTHRLDALICGIFRGETTVHRLDATCSLLCCILRVEITVHTLDATCSLIFLYPQGTGCFTRFEV